MASPLSEKTVAIRAAELGRKLTAQQARGVAVYLQLLEKWNKKMNLVGPRTWEPMLDTLVIDSWNLGDFLGDLHLGDEVRTLDLGAGAGLPGIPLRIFWDRGTYLLVEPRQKRAMFMQTAIRAMQLARTQVAACRVEHLPSAELPARLVVSRAFCPWREYLDIARPLLDQEGFCLVMANMPEPDEIPAGWRLVGCSSYPVGQEQRSFWLFSRAEADSHDNPLTVGSVA
jgi:16S rRNA (guanine527-N7)-methyltransferase